MLRSTATRLVTTSALLFSSVCLAACATQSSSEVAPEPSQTSPSASETPAPAEALLESPEVPRKVTRYVSLSEKSEYYPAVRTLSEEQRKTDFDADGLAITNYDGKRVFHPVDSAWKLMVVADSYEHGQDPRDWEILEKNLKHAIKHSVVDAEGGRWFVYEFDHAHKDMHMRAPWVSGMSQGMMLSLISRMYDLRPSEELKTYADEIFKTFLKKRTPGEFWVTNPVPCPDDSSLTCVFLEEYPLDDRETHVVNGHIYAMLGLHDYYRMTKNPQAKELFEDSAFAIARSFTTYRNPGQPSFYAVSDFGKETWETPTSYHLGVIPELRALTKITGDPLFDQQADVLLSDYDE